MAAESLDIRHDVQLADRQTASCTRAKSCRRTASIRNVRESARRARLRREREERAIDASEQLVGTVAMNAPMTSASWRVEDPHRSGTCARVRGARGFAVNAKSARSMRQSN